MTAGVIGGKEQAGKWKLTERFNKEALLSRIKRIANYAKQITVTNLDASELIEALAESASKNALIYLDPPYYVKGQQLYRNFYNHEDHVEIAQQVAKLGDMHWIVSYDNNQAIADIYKNYRQKVFDLQYTAQQKKMGSEIMVFSNAIKIPNIKLGKTA